MKQFAAKITMQIKKLMRNILHGNDTPQVLEWLGKYRIQQTVYSPTYQVSYEIDDVIPVLEMLTTIMSAQTN